MRFLCRSTILTCLFPLALLGCENSEIPVHPTTAPVTYREADEVKASLTYLASDQLEGRGLETQGIYKAADFIATQFRADGLTTLPGLNGYFQTFPIKLEKRSTAATAPSTNEAVASEEKSFSNIVACLPGAGKHRDEFVVVGAHYDHLGRGEYGTLAHHSRQIHNGADDNGSGTAAILELAEELSRQGDLDRSVVFVAFVGEERGLLGSAYFVSHPPVPLDKIVAMVNLDMVGRVRDNVLYVGGNGTAKDFDRVVIDADRASPLIVRNAGVEVGGRGGIGPSDHMSFALKHIPVIFFWSGMHADYHRPTDKADKINFVGIAEVVDFTQSVIEQLASMPREQYVDSYDHSMGAANSLKVRLGILPDYNSDPTIAGVRVAGTLADSPAAKAGVLDNDLIVGIDSDKVASLGDYMTVLAKHKPGDVVKIVVQRDKQNVELPATLGGPKS
ncbi:MAG TPA: M20/M25/M40 family metallo-hydrolase [Tepidisphaeraceae bacterium]|jgi:hypothetical protein|nr:M20/M25/M40 family metallo-hydrolase [Tepidisphaeraceae bacterium]